MSDQPKRACDSCHRRKVRCNSEQPCANCSQSRLRCTYDAIPQKKGPKGRRAKVICELRNTQTIQSRRSPVKSSPVSPMFLCTPGLLNSEMIDACIQIFILQHYPTMPILDEVQIKLLAGEMGHSQEAYCLILAFCAFIHIQPRVELRTGPNLNSSVFLAASTGQGTAFLDEALKARKCFDYVESPSINGIITSLFMFGSLSGLNKQNTAWNHLREATASAQALGMHDENSYMGENAMEDSRKRRLFWLLYVTEREYAIQKHRPFTLAAAIELPRVEDDLSAPAVGFVYLVRLYHPFDDTFIGLWNQTRAVCSPGLLAQMQRQLTDALPTYLNVTENQMVDLRISQQWLRTVVWQLSISSGCLSSTSVDPSMTFGYPVEVAQHFVMALNGFSKQSLEVHGLGLVEKIFDIGCALVDVISCVPIVSRDDKLGPQECLEELTALLGNLPGGSSRYLPLLQTKIADSRRVPIHSAPMPSPNDLISSSESPSPVVMSEILLPCLAAHPCSSRDLSESAQPTQPNPLFGMGP